MFGWKTANLKLQAEAALIRLWSLKLGASLASGRSEFGARQFM